MDIRLAHIDDMDAVMRIFQAARAYMRSEGNVSQWEDAYPPRELILQEIEAAHFYCVELEGEVVGVFSFIVGVEPTYAVIYDGSWQYDEPYGVIHRLASNGAVSGVGDACFAWCKQQHSYLRVDTHRDNKTMQRILQRQDFTRSGIITLSRNGDTRIAYEWKR